MRQYKKNRASARNAYDTYLSHYFRYKKNNEMYIPREERKKGVTVSQPLSYTQFEHRYQQMKAANVANPARMVAMEQREASELQLRMTWKTVKDIIDKASDVSMEAYKKNLQRIIGNDKITFKDFKKNYRAMFKTFMPYEAGDNPFLLDENGLPKLYEHEDRNEYFNSPKEEVVASVA